MTPAEAVAELDAAERAVTADYARWTAAHEPAWFWAAMAGCFIRVLVARPGPAAAQDRTLEAFIAMLRDGLARAQPPVGPGAAH